MTRRFTKTGSVVERKVRDSVILVPLGGDTARIDNLYTLNLMGSRIWGHAAAGVTEDEIVAAIVAECDVAEDTVRQDCGKLLDELVGIGALTVSDNKR